MTGCPTDPSRLHKNTAQLQAKHPSITHYRQGLGARRHPSPLGAGHTTPFSPPPLKAGPKRSAGVVCPLPSSLATTPHLWAGVEDLHGDLLGGWVRAPGHAGLLDHGEEPLLRPPVRSSRAPSAHERGRRNRVQRSTASSRPSHLARPRVALFQPSLPPPALSSAAAASSAPGGSASPPPLPPSSLCPPWPRPSQPLRGLCTDKGRPPVLALESPVLASNCRGVRVAHTGGGSKNRPWGGGRGLQFTSGRLTLLEMKHRLA